MELYEELLQRGLIAQTTNAETIAKAINKGEATFYIGFDPTADSLHVGHFMALCLMKRLQQAGNKPIVLIGGGTAMVGDPSGRSDMRSMLTVEKIDEHVEKFKKQISKFISLENDKGIVVNNADWLRDLNYIDLLREVGSCFTVNNMLRAECYKQRMEKGLSFLEFNYMIMQAYDFYYLNRHYNCNMQFGGDDQWSNMLAGSELVRKLSKQDVHSMTIPLLLNSQGKKMGKTVSGALWLDADKTSPFEFYQYWMNIDDNDVEKCLKMLTFLPLEQITLICSSSSIMKAKSILAFELTKMIHGEEEALQAVNTSLTLFKTGNAASMSTTIITNENITLAEALVEADLCSSKGEAKKLVSQGGISVDGVKVLDAFSTFDIEKLKQGIVLKKGKKHFEKIKLK